jgi:signal transduction histidine kinase/ActR/RegA family two-component response regulator
MSTRRLKTLAIIVVLAGVYFAAGKFGLTFASLNNRASAVWPPTGLALAAMLLFGNRVWPGVWIGAFLVNATTSNSPSPTMLIITSVVIATGNTFEAIVGAMLTRRVAKGVLAFERAFDLFRYVGLAAIPSTLISAAVGVAILYFAGMLSSEQFMSVWLTWWTGDFVSDLVVAPLLIIWAAPLRKPPTSRIIEAAALTTLTLVVGEFIFGHWSNLIGQYALPYFVTPLLIWAAFRFQQRGAAAISCMLSVLAIYGTKSGSGPFVASNVNQSLVLLEAFIGVNAISALAMAALMAERARSEAERERILASERAARREAERANRTKDEFFGILSHELRTPLAPVLLAASMLERDESLPAQARSDANLIRRNVELEARLIDDLLDVTRISHGKLTLDPRPTDVHLALRRAADICCSHRLGDLTLNLRARRHVVRGDAARLQQIFWNLLNNATKFTTLGKRIIVNSENVGDKIRIEIIDEGIGIDPHMLERLFEAFEQGDPSRTKRFGGLGLGLAITKALVEAHTGRITANSAGRDKGSVFMLEFPTVDAPSDEGGAGVAQVENRNVTRSLRILLVEDNLPTQQVMIRLLGGLGHVLSAAGSVQEAIALSKSADFDLVISDVGLPDGSGYDLMKAAIEIATAKNRAIKGIAISGYGRDEDVRMSREAGFSLHLTKPVDLDELQATIEKIAQ